MIFYDSGLLSINGNYNTGGANSQVDVENIAYVLPTRGQLQDGTFVETFLMVLIQNKGIGGVQIQYLRNGRTIDDFLDAINAVGSGAPLKLWTNLRQFNGRTFTSGESMYDISVIINDACQQGGRYIPSQGQTLVQVRIQNSISLIPFQFDGDQIGSAPIVYSITVPVYDGLSAQGTTSSTTSILQYGVNVFTTVTPTNYAAKLPQPITGKSVKVVNKGSITLSLFPSNVGGQINNYPIDYPAQIPPDGVVYEFTCIENPLPGAWTWTPPATNQIVIAEMTISHTNGVATNKFGCGGVLTNTAGAGLDGNQNIVLTGNWLSENNPTTISRVKCYTNILQSDLASEFQPDAIQTANLTAFKTAINGVTYGQRHTLDFSGGQYYGGSFAPTGTLSAPPLVGDTNTLYFIEDAGTNLTLEQIGTGGAFSRYYYTFGMFIPASAITKDYKFQWFLEYY